MIKHRNVLMCLIMLSDDLDKSDIPFAIKTECNDLLDDILGNIAHDITLDFLDKLSYRAEHDALDNGEELPFA